MNTRILRFVRTVFKIAAALILLIVSGIAALLGLLWLDHTRETTLPVPTGPFAVGRTTYFWSDPTYVDPLGPPGTNRQLAAWIWYPAAPGQPAKTPDDYMPAPWRKAMEGGWFLALVNRDLSRVHAHSNRDAEVSPQQHSYPVLLMRAGGAALTANYSTLAEDLASHGYVVVGIDAPYRSVAVVLPNGNVIRRSSSNNLDLVGGPEQEQLADKLHQAWTADLRFTLDRLEQLNGSDPSGKFLGRLDMDRVGVFGHSLGGATALQFCHDDARCKAGVDVDGLVLGSVVSDGVHQPFMIVLSDHKGEPGSESRPVIANFQSVYDRLPDDKRLMITINGGDHFGFSDPVRSSIVMGVLQRLGKRIDGRRQIALTEHYLDSFFDVYLKGAPLSKLKSGPDYPEVEYAP